MPPSPPPMPGLNAGMDIPPEVFQRASVLVSQGMPPPRAIEIAVRGWMLANGGPPAPSFGPPDTALAGEAGGPFGELANQRHTRPGVPQQVVPSEGVGMGKRLRMGPRRRR